MGLGRVTNKTNRIELCALLLGMVEHVFLIDAWF